MQTGITFLIIGVIVFIGLIFWVNRKRHQLSEKDNGRIRAHWMKIKRDWQLNPKGAVLEADKVLDEVLKLKGFTGSLGEKLKRAAPLFTNVQEIWSAHKLRNRIAHELDIQVHPQEAKTALQQFERGLKDLGIKSLT